MLTGSKCLGQCRFREQSGDVLDNAIELTIAVHGTDTSNLHPQRGCAVTCIARSSAGSCGKAYVHQGKTIYWRNDCDRLVGRGARPVALAEFRTDTVFLLPGGRRSCFNSQDSSTRCRRNYAGEFPIHFIERARTKPSRDAGLRLYDDPGAMPVGRGAEESSNQNRFQRFRNCSKRNRGVVLRLPLHATNDRGEHAAAVDRHCPNLFLDDHDA